MKTLDINEKLNVQYAIPTWVRDLQITEAIKRVSGRIQPHEKREGAEATAAVVGYGPSLRNSWERLRKFKYIFSCSGSHSFLIEREIIPTWHVAVDPLPKFTVKLIGQPHKDVEYLISSTCHPDVFDHLAGYNVKLWHVFANDEEAIRVLPRGEWALTGGCDVGLRAITIARFLGFTDLHVFGLDGSSPPNDPRHAGDHPNSKPAAYQVIVEGKTFATTPAMLEAARGVFHELNQMPDVKARFYGEGLIQHMAKTYKPQYAAGDKLIAFNAPEVIGEEYRELNAQLHRSNPMYGAGGGKHAETVLKLAEKLGTHSILDYGAGKQMLSKSLPFPIWSYDPAIPEISQPPRPADLVICSDVLEHVEPDKLQFVLDDLRRCVLKQGYLIIHTGPSSKLLSDGRNSHLIQQGRDWWAKKLRRFFSIPDAAIISREPLLHFIVEPHKGEVAPEEAIVKVQLGGITAKFFTPNKTTKWRAETLLTKEPVTIDWINKMSPGETLFDVGANIGGYSIWAGVRGIKVHAFEPEADNYALLLKNMALNGIPANAYCLALSDRQHVGPLYMSQPGVGGSCHSFNEAVGPDLKPRQLLSTIPASGFPADVPRPVFPNVWTRGPQQGCVGMTLDSLVESGLPAPDHLKIDVDGFEFRVVKGAEHILTNGLKSLLVEVNPSLPEHLEMVRYIGELGYEYDSAQVESATRKEGPFKGCAEYLFHRITPEAKIMADILMGAEVVMDPFPHIYIENALPAWLHADLLEHMPKSKAWVSLEKARGTKGYPKRFVATPVDEVWAVLANSLKTELFKRALCQKFGVDPAGLTHEALLIRDLPGYKIGPHTDSPAKVISALFYLQGEEGTSLYVPRQEGFTCPGGPHYSFNKFKRVKTIPFKPNSLFVFLKSDHSFHGVETIKHKRDVLLYDVQRRELS